MRTKHPLVIVAVLFFHTCACLAGQSVTLTWDLNTETNLAGYRVCWGLGSGVYTKSNTVPAPPCVVSNLAVGTNFFAVLAYDSSGLATDFSNEVSFINTNPPALAPPRNLKLTARVQGSWKLSGGDWADLASYDVPATARYPFYRLLLEREEP